MATRITLSMPPEAAVKLVELRTDVALGDAKAIAFARELKERFEVDVESIRFVSVVENAEG